jgi:ATP-dependent HslUV protease ATP-binding subunit HslU
VQEAVQAVETGGVVFIDEIDKTIPTDDAAGADVSAAGVQRDLLPLVEGTVLGTRYGPVRTDHILFVASGAFHGVRPSDLIPELQGRFPVRVEMHSLSEDDLFRILTQPDHAITRQYEAMLATEDVALAYDDEALRLVARLAWEINRRQDDIGARRLYTLMERVLEDVLFDAPEIESGAITVTVELITERVGEIADDEDLSLYIV